jgi:hypothetical protein
LHTVAFTKESDMKATIHNIDPMNWFFDFNWWWSSNLQHDDHYDAVMALSRGVEFDRMSHHSEDRRTSLMKGCPTTVLDELWCSLTGNNVLHRSAGN